MLSWFQDGSSSAVTWSFPLKKMVEIEKIGLREKFSVVGANEHSWLTFQLFGFSFLSIALLVIMAVFSKAWAP